MSTKHWLEPEYSDLGGGVGELLSQRELRQLRYKEANRIQQSLVAAGEKKLLVWLANRMPRAINSDHLTAIGSAGMLLAGLSYWMASWNRLGLVLATVFLAVNWFGDSLDGTLARVRNQQRPRYGFYVDHVTDTFGALFLMGGLALSGYASPAIALGMLIAFLMLSIESYLAAHTVGDFRLSFGWFGPTELRIVLGIGNTVLLFHPMAHVLGREYRLFDVGGVVAIASMVLIMLISAALHTARLYREEPLA